MFLKKSDRLAIVDFDGRHIDYNEMVDAVKHYARNKFVDIKENDRVLIVAENRLEWIYTLFSVWDHKAALVAVDALSSVEEIEYFLNDCTPSSVVVTNQTKDNVIKAMELVDQNVHVYNLDEIEKGLLNDDIDLETPDMDKLAVMIYTSGTTGSPKGVMLSMSNLVNEVETIKMLGVTKDDEQVLAILPFHHILPLMSTCIYFFSPRNQYSVVLLPKLTSQEILRCLQENRVTVLSAVPRVYKLFYKSLSEKINSKFLTRTIYKMAQKIDSRAFSKIIFKKVHKAFGGHLRTFIAGGAKSDLEMTRFFNTIGIDYCEGYGLSETSPVIGGNVPSNYKFGTVGKAADNLEVKTVNGELWVRGPIVMMGYYNKPEKTKEVITEDGWFKTGDLAEIDDEGYITILGRANAMIVLSNGKNIDPEKLEIKVMQMADDVIEEIGVFGNNDKLCAVIVAKKGLANTTTHIRDAIQIYNTKVHNYEKILDYKIVAEELPKTRVGKLRRFKLPELFKSEVKEKVIVNEPDTVEYLNIKKYIENIKSTKVGPDENFELEVGLDSLDQVELIGFIKSSFNVDIKEEDVINNPTLRTLSELVGSKSTGFNENVAKTDMSEIIRNAEVKPLKKGFIPWLISPIAWLLFKIYFRLSIKGKKKIITKGPVIFIANHESFVDAPIFGVGLPMAVRSNTYFLALGKYFAKGFMSFVANNANIIKVDIEKNIKESIESVASVLKQDKFVFIFPEGSRTKDGKLQEFKKIFAVLSKELNVKIQCIGIDGAYEAYSRFSAFPKPKKISLEVLDTIDPKDLTVEEIVEKSYDVFKDYKERLGK